MDLKSYTEVDIDFVRNKYININAKQLDASSRYILFTCYDDGNICNLNEGLFKAYVRYRKPDGYGVFNECIITDDGKILVELTEQMLAVSGVSRGDIIIVDALANVEINSDGEYSVTGGSIISTMRFTMNIIGDPLENTEIESSYEYNALNELLKTLPMADFESAILSARGYSDEAKEAATRAKTWSTNPPYIGTNGNWWVYDSTLNRFVDSGYDAILSVQIADVTTVDPSEDASVTNSGTDSDLVLHLYIPKGEKGEQGYSAYDQAVMGGYANTEEEFIQTLVNIKTYADTVEAKVQSAIDSANSASDSADIATTKANEIAGSADIARQSELNALASANAAQSSANAAASSAESAEASYTKTNSRANSATSAASRASGFANEAKASKEAAVTASTTATEKAQEVETAAQNIQELNDIAKSWAVGLGGTADTYGSDNNNAHWWYMQARGIAQGLQGGLLPMGTIAFAQLPTSNIEHGAMYNISDKFTTDDRFLEGAGIIVPAGAEVYYTVDDKWSVMAGSPVAGVKGNEEPAYRTGNVNITKANIGLSNVDNTSDIDKPVSTATRTAINTAKSEVAELIPSVMNGASSNTDGASGTVPKPNAGDNDKFLRGDGTWSELGSTVTTITATLTASGWNSNNQQTITVNGMTATTNGDIALSSSATLEQRTAAREAQLAPISQANNSMTIIADGDKPTVDIPVVINIYS